MTSIVCVWVLIDCGRLLNNNELETFAPADSDNDMEDLYVQKYNRDRDSEALRLTRVSYL